MVKMKTTNLRYMSIDLTISSDEENKLKDGKNENREKAGQTKKEKFVNSQKENLVESNRGNRHSAIRFSFSNQARQARKLIDSYHSVDLTSSSSDEDNETSDESDNETSDKTNNKTRDKSDNETSDKTDNETKDKSDSETSDKTDNETSNNSNNEKNDQTSSEVQNSKNKSSNKIKRRRRYIKKIEKANEKMKNETLKTKKGIRYKSGAKALKEIRRYQNTVNLLLPFTPFARLVREILNNFKENYRVEAEALEMLQEASENHLIEYFEYCNLAAIHAHRVTIKDRDSTFVKRIRKVYDK